MNGEKNWSQKSLRKGGREVEGVRNGVSGTSQVENWSQEVPRYGPKVSDGISESDPRKRRTKKRRIQNSDCMECKINKWVK